MCELDVDAHIKSYWKKIDEAGGSLFEQRFKEWEEEKYGGSRTDFYNPDDDYPMRLALFLSFMDVTPLEEAMKPFYNRLASVKYLGSMGRTLVFMKLKQLTPDQTVNHLKTHPADAELLGYEKDMDGIFDIPCGETIRLNLKNRFGAEGLRRIDRAIVIAFRREGEKFGVNFGSRCGSDAFPVESVGSDKEAEYNGHYGISGFKVAMTGSYDEETGIVPLVGEVIGINEDEGKTLVSHVEELRDIGIQVEDLFVDGKYATVENIAQVEVGYGTSLHYDIAKNWVYNDQATFFNLKVEYQKFHQDSDFKVYVDNDDMMRYLVKKGECELVGHMIRNDHIAAKEECPDGYLDHFHQRNMTESENDYIKNDHGLQRAIKRRGKEAVEVEFYSSFLALHVLALIRLQQGCTRRLVSKRGLT